MLTRSTNTGAGGGDGRTHGQSYGTTGGSSNPPHPAPVATPPPNNYPGMQGMMPLMDNPGASDFPEDDLHEVHLTVGEQLARSFAYGAQVKCLLVLLIPFALLVFLAPSTSTSGKRAPAAFTDAAATSLVIDGSKAKAASSASAVRRSKHSSFLPIEGGTGSALFWMALVLVIPVNTLMIEYLEDLVVRHDSLSLGIAVNLIFEHAAELLFCFFAMGYSKRSLCWVKPLLLGSILLNMLGVLGGSILAAPLSDGTSVDLGISSWTAFSAGGLVFSTAVFLLPTVYSYTVVEPDAVDQLERLHTPAKQVAEQQARNMIFISRSLSLCVLLIYALYLWKVVHSNSNYYVASDNPNAPSSLTYALQYRERLRNTQAVDLGSRYTRRFALTGACVCLAMLIFLCYVLVATLLAATKTVTSMPLPFTLVALLPLVFESGGMAASLLMAHVGRPDIAASIAFASIVHLYMFILPVVVLVGWLVLQVPLELSFHPFLVCCCFISALVVAQVMLASRVRWLEGGTLVALYGLIVCICLLGRWHLCSVGYS